MASNRFKLLLSGLFLVYLVLDGFRHYLSFYIAGILILGLFLDWYLERKSISSFYKTGVRMSSIPPQENSIFQLLGNLMRSYGLEMRLRRAEFLWNVTLLKNQDGVVRMVGRGSAPSITEAIMRAEGDFEKRNEPDAS